MNTHVANSLPVRLPRKFRAQALMTVPIVQRVKQPA